MSMSGFFISLLLTKGQHQAGICMNGEGNEQEIRKEQAISVVQGQLQRLLPFFVLSAKSGKLRIRPPPFS